MKNASYVQVAPEEGKIAVVGRLAVTQWMGMNKILTLLIGLGFVGLLGFTVSRVRTQARVINSLNLKITILEETRLRLISDCDELISKQQVSADSIAELKADISAIVDGQSKSVAGQSVSDLDVEKRLNALELWRLGIVDPTIEILKIDGAEISLLNQRLSKVEEKLKMDYP